MGLLAFTMFACSLGTYELSVGRHSGFNSFDSDPWILRLIDFTRKALEHPHVRVIGVCFGHQIVGRTLGS